MFTSEGKPEGCWIEEPESDDVEWLLMMVEVRKKHRIQEVQC